MQEVTDDIWYDALAEPAGVKGPTPEVAQSPLQALHDVITMAQTGEASSQTPSAPPLSRFAWQHLLHVLLLAFLLQANILLVISIWRYPAAFAVSVASVCLCTADPQHQAAAVAVAQQLTMHARSGAGQAWMVLSRIWWYCWCTAAGTVAAVWHYSIQACQYCCESATATCAVARIGYAGVLASAAAWYASLTLPCNTFWSRSRPRASSVWNFVRTLPHMAWAFSWQAAVSTRAAVWILLHTAWWIVRKSAATTAAAMLTTAIITLSTLLASGFIAAAMLSAAATACGTLAAAAAHRVMHLARQLVPVMLTSAGSCSCSVASIMVLGLHWAVTATCQGSTAVAAAAVHPVQVVFHSIYQHFCDIAEAVFKAAAKLQRQRPRVTLGNTLILVLRCVEQQAYMTGLTLSCLFAYCMDRIGVWLCRHSVGMIFTLGPDLCQQMWRSLLNISMVAPLLLSHGPAVLGCLMLDSQMQPVFMHYLGSALAIILTGARKVCAVCSCAPDQYALERAAASSHSASSGKCL